ncbi:MAG: DNA adenine methylase [Euryarchaeota archaeon]|nr:DNA adenine methylase [Euryarchaeota archaeon]
MDTLAMKTNAIYSGNCARGVKVVPHPIPYQGSKRQLAPRILGLVEHRRFRRLYEPFSGSAAITLAAARLNVADEYVLGDSLKPLIDVWNAILAAPENLANDYAEIWSGQVGDSIGHYNRVRDDFNATGNPAKLLYLLARCVKNSPRFNQDGMFNQSPDRRRRGKAPSRMRRDILGASALLCGRTLVRLGDFTTTMADATPADIVYLDPPYEGVTTGHNRRYYQGLERRRLVSALESLVRRGVPFVLSYDGRCGGRAYGQPLSENLGIARLELNAGRSTQATLNGRSEQTIESLYVPKWFLRSRDTRTTLVSAA